MDFSTMLRAGDRVRIRADLDDVCYEARMKFRGSTVTLREQIGDSMWYIYEDEGTCHIRSHKYGGWFWRTDEFSEVLTEEDNELAPIDIPIGELLGGALDG